MCAKLLHSYPTLYNPMSDFHSLPLVPPVKLPLELTPHNKFSDSLGHLESWPMLEKVVWTQKVLVYLIIFFNVSHFASILYQPLSRVNFSMSLHIDSAIVCLK